VSGVRRDDRGLLTVERRALVVDPSAPDEIIPDRVFDALVDRGLGRWGSDGYWAPTELGALALRCCPPEAP
jgi:hypothetical protein